MGNFAWGSNARARGTHSRAIGWRPRYTTQDMLGDVKREVQTILKQQDGENHAPESFKKEAQTSPAKKRTSMVPGFLRKLF